MHPNAIAYWAYILDKDGKSGTSDWRYGGKNNPKIRKIYGTKVYELVTGDPDALAKTWKALPKAITKITGNTVERRLIKEEKLTELFNTAFSIKKGKNS